MGEGKVKYYNIKANEKEGEGEGKIVPSALSHVHICKMDGISSLEKEREEKEKKIVESSWSGSKVNT